MRDNKKERRVLIAYTLVVSGIMLVWNLMTPLFDDDIYSTHTKISQIFSLGVNDYFHWNGRFWGQSIMRLLQIGNPILISVLNTIVFTIMLLLIFKIAVRRITVFNANKFILGAALVFVAVPVFGQVCLWRAGAGNYLWPTTLMLLFSYLYINGHLCKNKLLAGIELLLFWILGFIAGGGSENASGGMILVLTLLSVISLVKLKKRISWIKLVALMCAVCGYLVLLLSPGSRQRAVQTVGAVYFKQSLLHRGWLGFVTITDSLLHNYWLLISVFVILFWIMWNYYFDRGKMIASISWFVGGIATIYALALSPIEQAVGRPYFGGIIFIIISILILLPPRIADLPRGIRSFFQGGITLFTVYMLAIGIIGVNDSLRSDHAIQTQYAQIQQLQKKKGGDQIITVKPLSYQPTTKYSIDYGLQQIGKNPNVFPNQGYNIKYGIKGIKTK